jgi:non-ribosomal peptide synthetase component E (peptide arylation enzyme)
MLSINVDVLDALIISKAVEGLQSDIIAVKEYASDLQALLGTKVIAEEVQKEEECLMVLLSDDGYRQQLNLRYTINTKITDICCRYPSSDNKTIRHSSSFCTSSAMTLVPRRACRSDAYSLTAIMSLCNPAMTFEFLESCSNNFSIFDLILFSVSSP